MHEVLTIEGLPGAADPFLYELTTKRNGCDVDVRIYEDKDVLRTERALADFIIQTKEPGLIGQIINKEYGEFLPFERADIQRLAVKNAAVGDSIKGNIYYNRRKNMIVKALDAFLQKNCRMVFDGFLKFRLREYLRELKSLAADAVDDYIVMQEYNEFISLLRLFVTSAKDRAEKVHVVVREEGYDVLDGSFCDASLSDGEHLGLNKEDLLISTLISLAPKTVVIHSGQNLPEKIRQTIELVFSPGVVFCAGCEVCNP